MIALLTVVSCLAVSGGEKMEPTHVAASEDIVSKLSGMGFNYLHCQKAAINTSNAGVEEAMNWLLSHMNDPGLCFRNIEHMS